MASRLEDLGPTDSWVFKLAGSLHLCEITDARRDFWVPIIDKVLLSLSDQQLLTGLAVLIAGFCTHCSISVYHFSLINDLAWLSTTVHITTLGRHQRDIGARPFDRHGRMSLISCVAIMLLASCVMEGHRAWNDSWAFNAQCLFSDLRGNVWGQPAIWMSFNIVYLLSNYLLSIMTLYRTPNRLVASWLIKKPRQIYKRCREHYQEKESRIAHRGCLKSVILKIYCCVVVVGMRIARRLYSVLIGTLFGVVNSHCASFAIFIFFFAYGTWGIFADRKEARYSEQLADGDEQELSFGQIVPVLLLSSTIFVIREGYNDQVDQLHGTSNSQVDIPRRSSIYSRNEPGQSLNNDGASGRRGSHNIPKLTDSLHQPLSQELIALTRA